MGVTSAASGAFIKAEPQSEEEESEEEQEQQSKLITLRVKWVDDEGEDDDKGCKIEEVHFNVANDMPLTWLMIRYCDRVGVEFHTTRFEFKGAKLRGTDTPLQLSMLNFDLIYAYHFLCGLGRCSEHFVTLCIRVPKKRDTFFRVRRAAPLLPQLIRGLSYDIGSMSFVYDGSRLTDDETADGIELEDGDILDAFNFDESSSSLSIVEPPCISLKVVNPMDRDFRMRIKETSPLSKLFDRYRQIFSVPVKAYFMCKGRRLMGSKTVAEEQLEDGDEIKVINK